MKQKLFLTFDELPKSSFVRLNQLIALRIIPFSAATAWRRVRDGTFPKPVRISPQVTAWRVGEIREWAKCPGIFVACHREPKQKSGKGCAA